MVSGRVRIPPPPPDHDVQGDINIEQTEFIMQANEIFVVFYYPFNILFDQDKKTYLTQEHFSNVVTFIVITM